tara:strand:+ start:416 stop:1672 length:1257 start_codon:yes stop_codon:yes gene_type:complete
MAQEITQSLFGLDAPMKEPQRTAGLEGVLQRLETGASAGIRRGFGQKTAVEAQKEKVQGIIQQMQQQGIDIASPQGLTELGNRFTSAGLTGIGTAMMMQGRNQFLAEEKTLATIAKEREAARKSKIQADKALIGISDIDPEKFTTESLQAFYENLASSNKINYNLLVPKAKDDLGFANVAEEAIYSKFLETFNGDADLAGRAFLEYKSKQTINENKALVAKETGISKAKVEQVAKRANQLSEDAISQIGGIRRALKYRNAINSAFTGKFANITLGAAEFAEAFGIDVKGLDETQYLDRIRDQIAKQEVALLKGSLQVKELEFLLKSIGDKTATKNTLLNLFEDRIKDSMVVMARDLLWTKYQREGGDYVQYDFTGDGRKAQRIADSVFNYIQANPQLSAQQIEELVEIAVESNKTFKR